jgi:hypothetical protein
MAGIRRRQPELSDREVVETFIALVYGAGRQS